MTVPIPGRVHRKQKHRNKNYTHMPSVSLKKTGLDARGKAILL
jgi:hypothetical protein